MYTGKWTSQILISQPKTDDGLYHCDQKALQQSHFIPDNKSLAKFYILLTVHHVMILCK